MSKKRLLAIFAGLVVLIGLAGALRWLWHQRESAATVQVQPITPREPEPIHGLIHEVDETDVASSNGDVHIRTADGAYYDFQLVGEFVAVRSDTNDLEIQVRQQPWQGSSRNISTNTAVAINVAGDRVSFNIGTNAGLHINGKPASLSSGQPTALPKGGGLLSSNGGFSISWPDESAVQVILHGNYLDIFVELTKSRAGHVVGLFGNFDRDPVNDITARDGTKIDLKSADSRELRRKLYDVFGNSWRIRQSESIFDYASGESTATYTDPKFPYELVTTATLDTGKRTHAEEICKQAGVIDANFLDNCILDIAVTGDAQFTQSSVKAQQRIKLPEGFNCTELPSGGDKCTNYRPSIPGARVGSPMKIELETLSADKKNTESFDCTLIDAARRASCIIRTKGKVFAGSNVITRYTLDTGELHEEKGTMQPR